MALGPTAKKPVKGAQFTVEGTKSVCNQESPLGVVCTLPFGHQTAKDPQPHKGTKVVKWWS